MANIKHVGRIIENGRKCLVAYRTIPNDAYNCLIIPTERLEPSQHDSLINLVESNAAQNAYEFAEVLARNLFSDGSNMLATLHRKGLLVKTPTDKIDMIPNMQSRINLAQLNQVIAEQRGISVQDLALQNPAQEVASIKETSVKKQDDVTKTTAQSVAQIEILSPEDQAHQYRSEADKLSKQAAELRRKAEELVPIKRAAKSK
jgi:hypothetical protein